MVIAPQFDASGSSGPPRFSEGLAAVRVGGRYGFIDRRGRMVIAPQFDARIDMKHGHLTLGPPSFSEGLAAVHIGGDVPAGRWVYVDARGARVLTQQAAWAGPFSEGLATVTVGDWYTAGKTGFIDKQGRMAIAPQFDWAGDFSDGLAVIGMEGYLTGKGFVEQFGQLVIGPQFRLDVLGLGGELTRGKAGFIDRTGKTVIGPRFRGAGSFHDGLAAVTVGAPPLRCLADALLRTDDCKEKAGYIAR